MPQLYFEMVFFVTRWILLASLQLLPGAFHHRFLSSLTLKVPNKCIKRCIQSRCAGSICVISLPGAGHDSVQDPELESLEGLESINRNDGWDFRSSLCHSSYPIYSA